MPIAVKASIWFLLSTVLQKSLAFVTVPIFTRVMDLEQYGLYSAYLSWSNIFIIICTLNFETCAYMNGLNKLGTEKEKDQLAISLISLSVTITSIAFVIYILFQNAFNNILGLPTQMVLLMFVHVFFTPQVEFWVYKQRFAFRYIRLFIVVSVMSVLNAVMGLLFVLLSRQNDQAFMRVLSIELLQLVFGLTLYIQYQRKAGKLFSRTGWGDALKLHLPLLPHSLALNILFSADRVMINRMVGAAEAGIYHVGYSAAQVMDILMTSIVNAMRPWMYEKIKQNHFAVIRKTVNLVLVMAALMIFLFTSVAPEVIGILAPGKYHEAIYVIPPVAASTLFIFLYQMFVTIELYYERTRKVMAASVAAALLNIALNLIFIRTFGYIAAAYVTLVCYAFLSCVHYLVVRGISREYLDGLKIFNLRFIAVIALFAVSLTLLLTVFYDKPIFRYGMAGIVALIFAFNGKKFWHAIHLLREPGPSKDD